MGNVILDRETIVEGAWFPNIQTRLIDITEVCFSSQQSCYARVLLSSTEVRQESIILA